MSHRLGAGAVLLVSFIWKYLIEVDMTVAGRTVSVSNLDLMLDQFLSTKFIILPRFSTSLITKVQ
jgi:hypothetical protein